MILFKNSDTTHDDVMLNSKVETPLINMITAANNKGALDDVME